MILLLPVPRLRAGRQSQPSWALRLSDAPDEGEIFKAERIVLLEEKLINFFVKTLRVKAEDLGRAFGASITEAELRWLIDKEYARTAEDVVWRRSKLGLRLTPREIAGIEGWMRDAQLARPA